MIDSAQTFRNDIELENSANPGFKLEAFGRFVARRLEEAEVYFDLNIQSVSCLGPRGKRLNILGYGEESSDGSLTIICSQYFDEDRSLKLSDVTDTFDRALGFLANSGNGWLRQNLEPSSPEWELSTVLNGILSSGSVKRIRMALFSDGLLSKRVQHIPSTKILDLPVVFEIWDQNRISSLSQPGSTRESIAIDFTKWFSDGLPCLTATESHSGIRTYLAVIPGTVLTEIFDAYGSLLLESNVRTYLSARGTVNRGIQETLNKEPERFLAYNNGLTTTASNVEIADSSFGSARILRVSGWQIVNGGQTTASLAHYLRQSRGRNLDQVSVQMKLVIVDEADEDIVGLVAKYANSQNKVNIADLASTQIFHIKLEQLSRQLLPPAEEGNQYQSGWYYERARGQWENDRNSSALSADQRAFELRFPKQRRITKTDWAKYELSWSGRPDIVSRGAQTAFQEFAAEVTTGPLSKSLVVDDVYFRQGVAKAICYNGLRHSILRQDWYRDSPGYLANIVTYAIARFVDQVTREYPKRSLDLDLIWRLNGIPASLLEVLLQYAIAAREHLVKGSQTQKNVTQWAKSKDCWGKFKIEFLVLPISIEEFLLPESVVQVRNSSTAQVLDQVQVASDLDAIGRISRGTWEELALAAGQGKFRVSDSQVNKIIRHLSGAVPSEKDARILVTLVEQGTRLGILSHGDNWDT